jgi:hypothetical protein
VSFADLRKQKARDQFHSSGINITYTEQEKEDVPKKSTGSLLASRRDSQQSQRLPQTESSAASTTSEGPQTSPGPGKIICLSGKIPIFWLMYNQDIWKSDYVELLCFIAVLAVFV